MRRLSVMAGAALLLLSAVGCDQKSRMSMDAGMPGGSKRSVCAICDDEGRPAQNVGKGMANKFGRGFVNTFTGFIEWPMQTYKGYEHGVSFVKNSGWSKTVGVLKGLLLSGPGYAVGRTGSGLVEMGTFWGANRHDNDGIGAPLDDEYAWEEGTAYSIFEPDLGTGISPYGRKFVHGLADGLLGIAELPGQIRKGVNDKKVGTGIVKGFWYTLSRTASGIGDAFLFIFPNPKDTTGFAWEQKWSWTAMTEPSAGAPAKK